MSIHRHPHHHIPKPIRPHTSNESHTISNMQKVFGSESPEEFPRRFPVRSPGRFREGSGKVLGRFLEGSWKVLESSPNSRPHFRSPTRQASLRARPPPHRTRGGTRRSCSTKSPAPRHQHPKVNSQKSSPGSQLRNTDPPKSAPTLRLEG